MRSNNSESKVSSQCLRSTTLRLAILIITTRFLWPALVDGSGISDANASYRCRKGAEALLALQAADRARNALHRECDVPFLKSLGDNFDMLVTRTEFINTTRMGNPLRVAIHQIGVGTQSDIVVFIHGVLSDSTAWRHLAGALGNGHKLWLVDLPGCGQSDAPHPLAIERDGYSPDALAERILQALQQCLADPSSQSRRVILVGHSFGGTVCLRMFSNPELRRRYQDVLDQIDGMALFAPCDVGLHAELPVFADVINLKAWKADLGNALGVLQSRVAAGTRSSFHVPECATAERAEVLARILAHDARRRASQAMLRQAVPWNFRDRRPDWRAIRQLSQNYTNVTIPCLILWGEWDEVLPASMGHKIRHEIPNARLVVVDGCGHSLPSEKPIECAGIISDFARVLQTGSFESVPFVTRISPLMGFRLTAAPARHLSDSPALVRQ